MRGAKWVLGSGELEQWEEGNMQGKKQRKEQGHEKVGERLLLRPPPRPRTSKSWEGAPNTRRFTALPVIPLCSHWGGQASLLLPVPELGEEEEEQTTDKES